MNKKLVLIGAGGHAKMLFRQQNLNSASFVCVVAPVISEKNSPFSELIHIKDDDSLEQYFSPQVVELVNGIGFMPHSDVNIKVYKKFVKLGYRFYSCIDRTAVVCDSVRLDNGVNIMPGAIIQSFVKISSNTIVNTGAIIEHDCEIGESNHVGPGSIICGGVKTKENVFVGAGARIIQNISIGENVVIGSGVTITKDIPDNKIIFPVRNIIKDYQKFEL